jgi:hypothetical protein
MAMVSVWLGDRFEDVSEEEAERLVATGFAQLSSKTDVFKLKNAAQMAADREKPPKEIKIVTADSTDPQQSYKTRDMKAKK